eukprot:TRINITY_DN6374_c0_g1_i1.p1 TRINITY_DN6374_c0_g1~~TRINITY_DN6374_c0_g1_i1.p1  ORF type:complete len:447 (+),score=95.18 TRINITY_DN6374_c0_g1_i1:70-1341(+)
MLATAAVAATWLASSVMADCGCTSDETCCKDDRGSVCCLNDETVCVPQTEGKYPARCCPKWTVGCSVGSVGCCDPARPWQRVIEDDNQPKSIKDTQPHTEVGANTTSYYALFMGGIHSSLEISTLSASGHVTQRTPVTGPVKTWTDSLFGESTRVFPFDSKNKMFHFLDGSENTHPTLYSIPINGVSTARNLTTVTGYPLGFALHDETSNLVFSILKGDTFLFYQVNPITGITTQLGSINRGTNETDASYYAGYITGISQVPNAIYRLGYSKVSTQEGPGLGYATVSGSSSARWTEVNVPPTSYFYYSATRIPQSDNFVSLAPTKSGDHSFEVVVWGPSTSPTVAGVVADSHPPSFIDGNLGYIATSVVGTTFAGLVVHRDHQTEHLWGLVTMDIPNMKITYNEIQPGVRSGTTSLSGFGIAL